MRIFLTSFVFICCLAMSNATLKLLKSKAASLIYPVPKYRTVKYISAAPVVVPEPLPVTYARPISTYSEHISTYSVSSPSVVTYTAPISAPIAYTSTYVPVAVREQPIKIAYEVSPVVDYSETQPLYFEPILSYSVPTVEEHYSS